MKTRRFIFIVLIAILVRVVASLDSLWLDEIWSLRLALNASSFSNLIRRALAENSHLTTSLWMYLVGPTPHDWIYRAPAVFFSYATLAMAIWLGRRLEGKRGEWVFASVFGWNAFFVHYGSEARGYSELTFHLLAGFTILHLGLLRPSRVWNWIFGLNAVLGLASQPIFAMFLAGAGLWSIYRFGVETRLRDLKFLRDTFERFSLPAVTLSAPWILDWKTQTEANAPESTLLSACTDLLHFAFGVPRWNILLFAAGTTLLFFGVRAFQAATSKTEESSLSLLVFLVAAPFVTLSLMNTSTIHMRFLTPALPFLMILVIRGALETYDRVRSLRQPILLVYALSLFGNGIVLTPMLWEGRGHYVEALEEVARNDSSPVIRIGVDHLFRSGTLIEYFSKHLSPPRQFEAVPLRTSGLPPDWILIHILEDDGRLPPNPLLENGEAYDRTGVFYKAGPSGFHWALYRKMALAKQTAPPLAPISPISSPPSSRSSH